MIGLRIASPLTYMSSLFLGEAIWLACKLSISGKLLSDTEALITRRDLHTCWCFYLYLRISGNSSKKSNLGFHTSDVIISLITYIFTVSSTYNEARLPKKSFSLLRASFLHTYSLRSKLLAVEMDVSRTKIHLDTSIPMTSNSERREYYIWT